MRIFFLLSNAVTSSPDPADMADWRTFAQELNDRTRGDSFGAIFGRPQAWPNIKVGDRLYPVTQYEHGFIAELPHEGLVWVEINAPHDAALVAAWRILEDHPDLVLPSEQVQDLLAPPDKGDEATEVVLRPGQQSPPLPPWDFFH